MTALPPSSARSPARAMALPRGPLALMVAIGALIAWGTLSPPSSGASALPLGDKELHALAFALLIFPMALAAPRRALRVAPLCIVFGALIELVQPAVGRSAEWADLLADAVGVGLGLALARLLRHVHEKAGTR